MMIFSFYEYLVQRCHVFVRKLAVETIFCILEDCNIDSLVLHLLPSNHALSRSLTAVLDG